MYFRSVRYQQLLPPHHYHWQTERNLYFTNLNKQTDLRLCASFFLKSVQKCLSRAAATSVTVTPWCVLLEACIYLCCRTTSALLSLQPIHKFNLSLRDYCLRKDARCRYRLKKHKVKKKKRITEVSIK